MEKTPDAFTRLRALLVPLVALESRATGVRDGARRWRSLFDVNSDPHRVDRARLTWFLQITANVPAVMGNVVAQGDSNSIGCRIVVNGQVKAERISNEVNAYTHCLVKGA
jgi:hypothetical protein